MLKGEFGRRVRHWLGWRGLFFGVSIIAWTVLAFVSSLSSQYAHNLASPYILNPIVLAIGVITGWCLGREWSRGGLAVLLIVIAVVTIIMAPMYINASAAVGGLLIALAGLATISLRELITYKPGTRMSQRASAADVNVLQKSIILALIAGIGIWFVLNSQAAIVLALLVSAIIAFALWAPVGPPQWISVLLGCLVVAIAAASVIWLGSRGSWPAWLAAGESLSSARHTLWSDALSLWRAEPVLGAGPGAFTSSSELASDVPSLAAAHSLILQVGAELGTVGVLLLIAVFVGGLLCAAYANRRVALIAIAAWSALAVHTCIDHLEDFPIVGLMAGVILGWSGLRTQPLGKSDA